MNHSLVPTFDPIRPSLLEAFIWMHAQQELPYPIGKWHRTLMANIVHKRVGIAAPRGFAKSHYMSYYYPLCTALEKPGTNILLISASGTLAEELLAKIKNKIETSDTLMQFYGDQVGDKWTTDYIKLNNGSVIMAKGAGRQIRGFRPDIVICDDLETDEMVASVDRREKFDHWFWTNVVGMLLAHGQIIVVGTILDPDSFLAELIFEGRHGWTTKLYRAIKDDGTALWPDQWPLNVLDDYRKEQGSLKFEQEFMNNPIPKEARTFREDWFHYFSTPPKGLVHFTTVDPAISDAKTADDTAIVTCGVDENRNIYVIDYTAKRMQPTEIIDEIFRHFKKYKSAVVGIETVGYQKMLFHAIKQERLKRQAYPVITELKDGGRQKDLRIKALQPFFETGKIFMKETQDKLKVQLLRFPSPRCHDDIIDALAYQLDIIHASRKTAPQINPDSFLAHIENKRRSQQRAGHWGEHHTIIRK